MKTYVYMVRHGESPKMENNERERGLTEKGWLDAGRVTDLLKDEGIDVFVSSPYRRAVLTIEELSRQSNKEIILFEDLREIEFTREERILTDHEVYPLVKTMLFDSDHSLFGGESARSCMNRAVGVLHRILEKYQGKKIAVGTHGMVMILMMRCFDQEIGYDFLMKTAKPDVYKMEFQDGVLLGITSLWER